MTGNPFAILGIAPGMELVADELEAAYLRLSRECHPDFHPELKGDARLEMLSRSADLNEAYRRLRDPWLRAETLIAIGDPEAMDATKTLCPVFLEETLEIREELEDPGTDLRALEQTVHSKVEQYFSDVAERVTGGEIRAAATLLHQSNYYRKALTDLRQRLLSVS